MFSTIDDILKIVEAGATLVNKLMGDAKQTGNLTPEQEQALRDRMNAAFSSAAWQPDKP